MAFGYLLLESKASMPLHSMIGSFGPVVSTDRRNTCFKFLCWGLVLQGLSGPFVKLACDGAEFGLAEA